jgi:general secretion pathway protein F
VGVVLPRFAALLADLGQPLPASTRLVLDVATMGRNAALPVTFALLVIVGTWRAWIGTEEGLRCWHMLLLGIPAWGDVRRAAAAARGSAALAGLLESGVSIAPALAHAARATGDAAIAARLLEARLAVTRGERLSQALFAAAASTPTTVRLARAGEESGRLAAMLAHASRLERERALAWTRGMVRVLEPGLILIFGGIIAVVAAALLQAVYGVRPGP